MISVALAGVISVAVTGESWDLFDSMIGVLLMLVLLGYGNFLEERISSPWEFLAASAVWGFCALLVLSVWLDDHIGWLGMDEGELFGVAWVVASLVIGVGLFLLQRSRVPRS